MGSLESALPLKRESLLRSSSAGRSERYPFLLRPRSRFSRFLLSKKLDYLQWICTVAVFLFFVVLFQMFLPGSVIEKSQDSRKQLDMVYGDLLYLKDMGTLDFGEDIKLEPSKLMEKFQKEAREVNLSSSFNRTQHRFGYRKPQLALDWFLSLEPIYIYIYIYFFFCVGVCGSVSGSTAAVMVTVATALQEIGYTTQIAELFKDSYGGILVNSLETKEPFKSIPLIWTIHERTLAVRSRQYTVNGQIELVNDWKRVFNRATVVVFPNLVLPIMYSAFDAGNYYVIPGSPAQAWEADDVVALYKDNVRLKMGYGPDDVVITIVGSQFLYRGLWLEHALILQALLPLFSDIPFGDNSNFHLKIIVLSGNSSSNYSVAVEAIAVNLHYPRGAVKHIAIDGDAGSMLNAADIVVYGSFHEEQSFPEILIKAMCIGKPIIAPDLHMIRKYVDDRVNGFLFPKENIRVLTQIVLQVISNGKLSPLARNIASVGKGTAKNLMVAETVEGYASLLEKVIRLPSEVALPKAFVQIPAKLKEEWCWHRFGAFLNLTYEDRTLRSSRFLDKVEEQWNHTQRESSGSITSNDESFSYEIWKEEKDNQIFNARKRREEEELKDRSDQPHGTWEEVYRGAKRADRTRNDLHERDEGELERTGQPLCIYEPYFGEGTWSFLHLSSLYRGIGLSTKGRRPRTDDVDGPSRLPLLNNPYYRDTLGEYGAFLQLQIELTASLSRTAEKALLDAIQTRRHGDTLYFWVRMDMDPRNPLQQDFWSFCDAINAGNCKSAFSEAFRSMYGVEQDLDYLPPMPDDGDTWSVMLSWALPTRSFLEFVMFSRMFVDALDAQMYEEHHQSGHCYLSLSKDKHCYSRALELLINVWAYHSARQMVYVNPETGLMQEQHKMKSRRGKMWVKWFSYATLKSMDEDLAEEADSDHPKKRWLWPSTGEVVWQGVFEKERNLRNRRKEKRKQQSKDKLHRMRRKRHQKVIGRYVKPPPEEIENSNSTMLKSLFL
ncbi:hypothetical protein GH714_020600 [Hevea brasiliensis]|uniref:Glycosyl transferase family 1 domain-containing protein n=1 Tax=Hevea brasiliensis TaxID=3981 RepID=A0A6A6KT26_HEVBR|nr:hypothetical protein GH714_020600 [Hevea brasiliensis]